MSTEEGMDPKFRSAVDQMIANSGGRLFIKSGFRDNALQKQLFDAAVAKYGSPEAARKWVAPPGKSNHNRGLAADIGGDMNYLAQVAPQYGLERPMSWEPWHVEPVGLREHQGTSPDAYPSTQPGTVNPTQDPSLNSRPETLLARLSAVLNGTTTENAASGEGSTDSGAGATTDSGGVSASATGSVPAPKGGKGSVDPTTLYKMLRAQGLDPAHAAALVAIAGRESGYNAGAHNGNAATGDNSFGLFQINKINGMHSQFSDQQLLTAEGSAAAAAELVKGGGLQPWGGYKGVPWSNGTNLQGAVDASGGEVSLADLQGLS